MKFDIGFAIGVIIIGLLLDISWPWIIAFIFFGWIIRRVTRVMSGRGDFFDFDGDGGSFGDGGGDSGGGD